MLKNKNQGAPLTRNRPGNDGVISPQTQLPGRLSPPARPESLPMAAHETPQGQLPPMLPVTPWPVSHMASSQTHAAAPSPGRALTGLGAFLVRL